MKVTVEEVERIAALAKLRFSPTEKETFVAQFNEILQHIEKLNELNLSGVAPMQQVIDANNVFREDEVQTSLTADEALANAPARRRDYFSVPKVIGG